MLRHHAQCYNRPQTRTPDNDPNVNNIAEPLLLNGDVMPISVVCRTCTTKLRAPESLAGRKTKCPKSGSIIEVPFAVVETAEPPTTQRIVPTTPPPVSPSVSYSSARLPDSVTPAAIHRSTALPAPNAAGEDLNSESKRDVSEFLSTTV